MCNPKPGTRCQAHAYDRYVSRKNRANSSVKAHNEFLEAQHDFDLVVVGKAAKARANIEHFEKHPETFNLLDEKGRQEYDRDFETLARYVKLRDELSPQELQELRDEARARGNIGHYLSSKYGYPTKFNLPEQNSEIVEMFDLLKTDPAGRPLTPKEQEAYDEAAELLRKGETSTPHNRRKSLKQEAAESTSASPSLSELRNRLHPSEQERVRAERAAQRERLLRMADSPSLGTPTPVNPSRLPAEPSITQRKRPSLRDAASTLFKGLGRAA